MLARSEGTRSGPSKRYLLIDGRQLQVDDPRVYAAVLEGAPYRVFYEPRSARVLSLEPIGQDEVSALGAAAAHRTPADDARGATLAAFARGAGFDLSDLEANRRGEKSRRQRRKLALWACVQLGLAIGATLFAAVCWYGCVLERGPVVLVLFLFAVLTTAIALTFATGTCRAVADSLRGDVAVEVGRFVEAKRGSMSREIELENGRHVRVPVEALSAQGLDPAVVLASTHRVYYAHGTGELLSFEPVERGRGS